MRKFMVFMASSVLLFLLFATATTSIVVLTVTPNHLKQWLKSSNVYETVVDTLIKQGQTAVDKSTESGSDSSSVYVQTAIKKAATPEFLQTSTEQLIDGTTPWLEGKSPQPTFAIDVSAVK